MPATSMPPMSGNRRRILPVPVAGERVLVIDARVLRPDDDLARRQLVERRVDDAPRDRVPSVVVDPERSEARHQSADVIIRPRDATPARAAMARRRRCAIPVGFWERAAQEPALVPTLGPRVRVDLPDLPLVHRRRNEPRLQRARPPRRPRPRRPRGADLLQRARRAARPDLRAAAPTGEAHGGGAARASASAKAIASRSTCRPRPRRSC